MRVELQKPTYEVKATGGGFLVSMPAKVNIVMLMFLLVWLGFWTFGGLSVFRQIVNGGPNPIFNMIWLIGWAFGEVMVTFAILWQFAGKEELTVQGNDFVHRVSILGFGRTREYSLTQVRDIRAVPQLLSPWQDQRTMMPPLFGQGHGSIAFDFGAKTYRVGASVDEAEAKTIVNELKQRLPNR